MKTTQNGLIFKPSKRVKRAKRVTSKNDEKVKLCTKKFNPLLMRQFESTVLEWNRTVDSHASIHYPLTQCLEVLKSRKLPFIYTPVIQVFVCLMHGLASYSPISHFIIEIYFQDKPLWSQSWHWAERLFVCSSDLQKIVNVSHTSMQKFLNYSNRLLKHHLTF